MQKYSPFIFEDTYGHQILKPLPSDIPEGWIASENFRALPGDVAYGVPVVYPGPDGWALKQFRQLQSCILDLGEFKEQQQQVVRELIARCLPLLQRRADFPITPDDIRANTGGFHKRNSPWMLFGEYRGTSEKKALMFTLDAFDNGVLTVISEDYHRDCLRHVPVTCREYLSSLLKPTSHGVKDYLACDHLRHFEEDTPEWTNHLALKETEMALFALRRRLSQVDTVGLDRMIPPPISTAGELKALHLAYQASEPGQPLAFPKWG